MPSKIAFLDHLLTKDTSFKGIMLLQMFRNNFQIPSLDVYQT